MIKKENFCRLIKTIQAYTDELEDIHEVMPGLQEDIIDLTGDLVSEMVEFLDAEMGLPKEEHIGSTISWWIWDCNFGKEHPDIFIKSKDGRHESTFHLNTVEKLYDYLIKHEADYEVRQHKRGKIK